MKATPLRCPTSIEMLERLSLAVAGSNDGIWDWNIATNDLFLSERSQRLYGIEPGRAERPMAEWLEIVRIHPDDLVRQARLVESFLSGKPPHEEQWRILHPDGVYRWVSVRGNCIRDASGKPTRAAGSVSDIDNRVRTEAALRASEERFALAVAGSHDGIWDWNIVTDEMFFSERTQRLYGLQPGPTVRPRGEWRALVKIHPDDAAHQLKLVEDYLAGGPAYDGKWRVLHADGVYRWVRIRGICVRDHTGQATRLAGSVSDVDSQVRAEAALLQAKRLEATGTLAGGIAHDFNNILAAILGFGEIALRDARRGSRLSRDIENIMVAGERGRTLVDRMLAFSRTGIVARVPVHVEGVVREAVEMLSATLPGNVRIATRLNAGRAALLGDATQMHQVFMNLATNAIQAMPAGGTLRVSLDTLALSSLRTCTTGPLEPGGYLVLSVADEGAGISADVVERMFDPFFTTKEAGSGTGLGLSVVHGIVTDVGGAVDVKTSGAGSELTVYLPRANDMKDDRETGRRSTPRGNHQQVLVVDDESALVNLMTEVLTGLGYVPVGFTSGDEALAAFRAHPKRFDAVITDERMPGLSGAALIERIRAIRKTIPILLLSGHFHGDEAGAGDVARADEILKKPASTLELATSLAGLLRKRSGQLAKAK